MAELSDEERDNLNNEDYFDLSEGSQNEPVREDVLHDDHSSESEQSGDDGDEPIVSTNSSVFQVFFGTGKKLKSFG